MDKRANYVKQRGLGRSGGSGGFLLFTALILITIMSGLGAWIFSRQRDQLQLLSSFERKMHLFTILERRVSDIADRIRYAGIVPHVTSWRSGGAVAHIELRCLIDEEERQVWEVAGSASLGVAQTRIVRVVTLAPRDSSGQLDTSGADEGSFYVD